MRNRLQQVDEVDTVAPGPRPATCVNRVLGTTTGGQIQLHVDGGVRLARSAVPGYTARSGDLVLVTHDDAGDGYVIGILETAAVAGLLDEALASEAAPASENNIDSSACDKQKVHDKRGLLLFEYDPVEDRAVLHTAAANLQIRADQGAVEITARDGVRLATPAKIEAHGGVGVELESGEAPKSRARLLLHAGNVSLLGRVLNVGVERAELLANRVGLTSKDLESHVDHVRHLAKVIETRAERIVERTKDSYREVERLQQTRAGRVRLVAKHAMQLVGENLLVKARDRVKIRGERIHLA